LVSVYFWEISAEICPTKTATCTPIVYQKNSPPHPVPPPRTTHPASRRYPKRLLTGPPVYAKMDSLCAGPAHRAHNRLALHSEVGDASQMNSSRLCDQPALGNGLGSVGLASGTLQCGTICWAQPRIEKMKEEQCIQKIECSSQ
jgi:hypothetical protein